MLTLATNPVSPSLAAKPKSIDLRDTINPERWEHLHRNTRILCVDDHSGALKLLQDKLSALYPAGVDIENDSLKVRARLEAAVKEGRPYDLVILDLHMPKLSGIEVLKSCSDLLKSVLVHTASMMSPVVAKLYQHMDQFRAQDALSIVEAGAQSNSLWNGIAVPIFLHHKTGSLSDLVTLADTAILTARHHPESLRKFASQFSPELIPASVPDELVHAFAEDVRVLASEINTITHYLFLETDLSKSQWWQKIGHNVTQALDQCLSVTYQRLCCDEVETSALRLHDMLTPVQFLEPPSLHELADIQDAQNILSTYLEKWNDIYDKYRTNLSTHYNALLSHANGEIDIWSFYKHVRQNLPTADFLACNNSLHDFLAIEDPKGQIVHVIKRLTEALSKRASQGEIAGKSNDCQHLSPNIFDEKTLSGLRLNSKTKEKQVGERYYLHFNYMDTYPTPLEESLTPLLPSLYKLSQEGGFAWRAGKNGDQQTLEIAIELKSTNLQAQDRITGTATSSNAWNCQTILVDGEVTQFFSSDIYPDTIAVGALPTDRRFGSPVILEHAGKKLFVLGDGEHITSLCLAADFINAYYNASVHWSEFDDACSRIYIHAGSFAVKNKINLAGSVLEQLGIHPSSIREAFV